MKKIISIIALTLALTSCNEWLDIQPETEIREEQMFETEQGFKDVLTGVYIKMGSSSLYGLNTTMLLPEFMVRNWKTDTDMQSAIADFDFTQTSAKYLLETIWVQYYQCIVNINSLLDKIDAKKSIFTSGNYELIKGEAMGLRAFLHFEILRFWGDIPGEIQPGNKAIPYMKIVTKDPNLLVSDTYQEVLANILSDLKASETLLANDPILIFSKDILNNPSQENNLLVGDEYRFYRQVRFNLLAVKATLARYYMWTGDKTVASDYAKQVIDATDAEDNEPVFTLGNEDEASIGKLTFPTEQIFAVSNSLSTQTLTPVFFSVYTGYTQKEAILNEAFESVTHTSDIRYKEHRLWEVKVNPQTFNHFKKYRATESTAVNDIPLIRLAEMYFIVTENGDTDLFREYRVARGLDISLDGTLTTQEEINLRLEKEYRKDFYGEGQMFFFYKRMAYETFTWPTTITMDLANYKLPIPETQTLFE